VLGNKKTNIENTCKNKSNRDEINTHETNTREAHVLSRALRRQFLKLDKFVRRNFFTAWYSRLQQVVHFSLVNNLL